MIVELLDWYVNHIMIRFSHGNLLSGDVELMTIKFTDICFILYATITSVIKHTYCQEFSRRTLNQPNLHLYTGHNKRACWILRSKSLCKMPIDDLTLDPSIQTVSLTYRLMESTWMSSSSVFYECPLFAILPININVFPKSDVTIASCQQNLPLKAWDIEYLC